MKKLQFFGFITSFLVMAFQAQSQSFFDLFPEECVNATDSEPMPGHILRVGFVASTADAGWSFFFPDQRASQDLQMVQIIENAGLIGRGYDALPDLQYRTPTGSFVVAQIYVGDDQAEPVVTCLSRPILLNKYVPKYYGVSNAWLDRGTFDYWLKWRKYSRWKWRDRWQRDIYDVRTNFNNKYRDRYRERYEKKWRERPNKDRWKGKGGWKRPVTTLPVDSGEIDDKKPVRPGRPEKPVRPQRPDRPEKPIRPERPDRPEKPERPERPDRPEKPVRPERPERPERPDRRPVTTQVEPVETQIGKVERPERIRNDRLPMNRVRDNANVARPQISKARDLQEERRNRNVKGQSTEDRRKQVDRRMPQRPEANVERGRE